MICLGRSLRIWCGRTSAVCRCNVCADSVGSEYWVGLQKLYAVAGIRHAARLRSTRGNRQLAKVVAEGPAPRSGGAPLTLRFRMSVHLIIGENNADQEFNEPQIGLPGRITEFEDIMDRIG